jgi:hypothetical protein
MAMLERGVTAMLDLGPGQDQSRLVQALSSDIHILDVPNI